MKNLSFWHFIGSALLAFALSVTLAGSSAASTSFGVIYAFTGGTDGGNPATGLVFDSVGNGYGTTVVGGLYGCGTVFKLKPLAHGAWQESVLYNFTCFGDGKNPHGGVTFDGSGNLYGTTVAGGAGGICAGDGCGVVFELTPGGEKVLYNFTGGNDGFGPGNAVVFDKSGNLFGTTPDGGTHSMGTVYQLTRSGGQWHERIIHNFTGGADGAVGSMGPLLVDGSGNLFGVTEIGGNHSAGTAYKMSPDAHGGFNFFTIYAFKGRPDAGFAYGGLISGSSGDLFGTTYYAGAHGHGAVFELTPNPSSHIWSERVLYSFKGNADGTRPSSTLLMDGSGNLFGTTAMGGSQCSCGTVFELSAHTWTETVLHRLASGTDGMNPYYGLSTDGHGNLFAAAVAGGANGQGTIFAVTP
jgi:uncharacterized repeat protein (TIGR03803 family)